jgi:hypothetical protein
MPVVRDQVFISYSHKDREWLSKLQTMLKPMVRNDADLELKCLLSIRQRDMFWPYSDYGVLTPTAPPVVPPDLWPIAIATRGAVSVLSHGAAA